MIVEKRGENIEVIVSGTNADGSSLVVKYTVPEKSGTGHVEEGAFDGIS